MKPLTNNSGGLVDFKENIVFEEYKDKVLKNANSFKYKVLKKYGFKPSTNLYKKIVNYQIEKYGKSLMYVDATLREYDKDFCEKTPYMRKSTIKRLEAKRKAEAYTRKLEERNTKR